MYIEEFDAMLNVGDYTGKTRYILDVSGCPQGSDVAQYVLSYCSGNISFAVEGGVGYAVAQDDVVIDPAIVIELVTTVTPPPIE